MKTQLSLTFVFEASHTLAGYEVPHPHLWRVELNIAGTPFEGKILDLVAVRGKVQQLLDSISHSYLNDCGRVGPVVRSAPTCETLSQFLFEEVSAILKADFIRENPSVSLHSVLVGIQDMAGVELGAVRVLAE